MHAHKAGERIDVDPDILFSRYTDRELWRRLNKKPLEVGANLIARTAHAALQLLGQLRKETELAIPLAWNPDSVTETCAIEVYPLTGDAPCCYNIYGVATYYQNK